MRRQIVIRGVVGLAAFGLLSLGVARAQEAPATGAGEEATPQQEATAQAVEPLDPVQQVLSRLHRINTMTMEAGQLAEKNAASKKVKRLAKDVARTQQKWAGKVVLAARDAQVELVEPTPIDAADREFMSRQNAVMLQLRQAKGEDFDKRYLTALIQRRDNVIPILKDLEPQIVDQQVKSLVSKSIRTLEEQRDRARKILAEEFPAPGA